VSCRKKAAEAVLAAAAEAAAANAAGQKKAKELAAQAAERAEAAVDRAEEARYKADKRLAMADQAAIDAELYRNKADLETARKSCEAGLEKKCQKVAELKQKQAKACQKTMPEPCQPCALDCPTVVVSCKMPCSAPCPVVTCGKKRASSNNCGCPTTTPPPPPGLTDDFGDPVLTADANATAAVLANSSAEEAPDMDEINEMLKDLPADYKKPTCASSCGCDETTMPPCGCGSLVEGPCAMKADFFQPTVPTEHLQPTQLGSPADTAAAQAQVAAANAQALLDSLAAE